jgi:hypothetical protein
MAKAKKDIEKIIPPEENNEEYKTVIGIAEAETLQKSGWQLISCHLTSEGKEYKFRKDK